MQTETTSVLGISDDLVQPFQIESTALRGRLVRLGPVIDTIYPLDEFRAGVARLEHRDVFGKILVAL